ncbi:hypothetical protein QRD43_03520 [Pelomonas sp. APW6]|uniref:Uncharacterized protein n=1 Tax=Roseateles subflavus TaxID=3053353 RepID=A0ABT7LDL8_9BURK|nr:hypothetical protein [Pelomonas sp. APW6]MDL5030965.1 hypothetical protein [Pelomonas sp. APW6]
MPAITNSHVVRLHRFLPFSAAHDQIYEEYQTGEDNLDLATVAISYAAEAVRAGARCVILTGDAGHGKTHMCRRLIEAGLLGHDAASARRYLLDSCDGSSAIPPASGVDCVPLRIHKDLSEIQPPSNAVQLLEEAGSRSDEALVVCANEGRLRAIINSGNAGPVCRSISALFKESFERGVTANAAGTIHIINLNYQSVAARTNERRGSLLRRVLSSWVSDGRRWGERSCGSCVHEPLCPIRRNRTLLAEQGATSELRIKRLEEVFEVLERLGHVVTIREMLMLAAYLITGGLTCSDVDRRLASGNHTKGWQHAWAFYNLLFQAPPNLPVDRADKGIPLLAALRRLDAGAVAVRRVDERILNRGEVFEPDQLDLQFLAGSSNRVALVDAALGIDDFNGNPQTRADLVREAETTGLAVAALRRRAFFDDIDGGDSVMLKLGFKFGDMFLKVLEGQLPPQDRVRVKNTMIAGLHSIQGLRIGRAETMLYLVDPAFGKASADAAIVARQVPSSRINLHPAKAAWLGGQDDRWFMPRSVDWIDRSVILRVDERLGSLKDLQLDLLSFECIGRAASGYVSEEFYANEIRRVRTFLGQLAEGATEESAQITVFTRGQLQNVSLDQGVIQVGGE